MTWEGMINSGIGGVVTVRGSVGSGKTVLLTEFARLAAARGIRCITVTAGAEGANCWNLLDEVLAAVGHREADPAAALAGLAAAGPLAVLVDDLQRLGAAPAELTAAVAQLGAAGVLVVLADDVEATPAWAAIYAELLRLPCFRSIRLPPLTRSGVREVLSGHLDGPCDPELVAEVCALTAGNPLLVRALVEDLLAVDAADRLPMSTGHAFQEVMSVCLSRIAPQAAQLAECVAVLGDATDPAVLAAVVGVDEAGLPPLVRTLAGIGLFADRADPAFRSPGLGAAVRSVVSAAGATDLRVRTASALRSRGAEASEVAALLLEAGCAPDEWGVAALFDAAERCLHEGDVERARRYLCLAALPRPGRECSHADTRAVSLGWLLDPAAVPRRLAGAVDAVAGGGFTPHEAIVLAGQLLWHGWHDEAVPTLAWLAANRSTFAPDDAEDVQTLSLHIAITYPGMARHLEPAGTAHARSDVVTRASDALLHSMHVLRAVIVTSPSPDLVREALRSLEVCALRRMPLEPSLFALLSLIYADELESAAHWCDQLLEEAARRGIVALEATLLESRAHIALTAGDLPAVELYARRALDVLPAEGWGTAVGAPLSVLVGALVGMGRFEDAAAELGRPVPAAMFRTVWGLRYLRSRGYYYLHTGGARAALGDFRSIGSLMAEWNLDSPVLLPWRSDAAEVHLQLGEGDEVVRLLDEQAGLPGGDSGKLRGVEARIRASNTDRRDRSRARTAAVAVEHLEAGQDRLELAKALAVLGDVHRASGDGRRARMVIRRALHLATLCRAEPLVSGLTGQQRPARAAGTGAERGLDSLSDAERLVAELASWGNTNREIARSLHVTISTVEQHLTRVYRKLNVRRSDLPADLGMPAQAGSATRRALQSRVEAYARSAVSAQDR
ncbi:helix-turn-helix transcriptional regulator [Amycolatopsis jiangsuensis]|uniref:DNA-binding CsgD family transcriptional regulator n=1 Tax=Amycolatopsis jiangsuensis TaxID=1181879 RepID=A0A840IK45_9PSEU|nr:helix-turn-helix transcriptional regulator [Amycolatopsis jiangsuensis]MBB4682656.1 DNA-binding CsgD family transcriptional regulator [Amycolatopsis jiangsuensis]